VIGAKINMPHGLSAISVISAGNKKTSPQAIKGIKHAARGNCTNLVQIIQNNSITEESE
jgi:hypothetical protein